MIRYLERISLPEGHILWEQGDSPDGLYIIEAGVLRATYQFADNTRSVEESMVPGTLAGELSALSNLSRNATAIVERPAVLWKLSIENLRRLELEEPELARVFVQLVLKGMFLYRTSFSLTYPPIQLPKLTTTYCYPRWLQDNNIHHCDRAHHTIISSVSFSHC